jgi:hypothetical protein
MNLKLLHYLGVTLPTSTVERSLTVIVSAIDGKPFLKILTKGKFTNVTQTKTRILYTNIFLNT